MVPALDGGDDAVWVGGPDERLRVAVGFGDEAMNGSLQLDDRAEHAALQASSGELGEEALDGVEPRGGGRRVVEDEARMPAEPRHHLGMLVGGVVVEDDVHHFADRHLRLDGIEEAEELLVPMTRHAASDYGAFEDVQGGEQPSSCRCACNRGSSCRS